MKLLLISGRQFFEKLPLVRFNIKNHTSILPTSEIGKVSNFLNKRTIFLEKDILLLKEADSLLVCNFKKGKQENYIGAYSLIIMSIAFSFKKKIYLLYDLPKNKYKDEIESLEVICLKGDLKNIK